MKRLILIMFGLGALIGLTVYLNRPEPPPVSQAEPLAEPGSSQTIQNRQAAQPQAGRPAPPSQVVAETRAPRPASLPSAPSAPPRPEAPIAFNHTLDVLVSAQASHEQRQAAWQQLREAGKLDQAIGELEQRAANDPRMAEYPAALGQAYLQKCGTIKDVREQGILAIQADKVFDTALSLDPWNWEARFTKAVAMSYWPSSMNKGQEVMAHFQALVQQQEAQAPQPQFAETYLLLGDQYNKAGHSEEARKVWDRGAAWFPQHEGLKNKLASAQ